jgi:hypothetical protein
MLLLVGYDLDTNPEETQGERQLRIQILEKTLKKCGVTRNVRYGPRFVDTKESAVAVCTLLRDALGPRKGDHLLVLPVCRDGYWAERELSIEKKWLTAKKRLGAPKRPLLALAYTLHQTERKNRRAFTRDLEALPIFRVDGYCHPLHALSFLATDRTPWAVRDEVAKSLPDDNAPAQQDELLVIPVDTPGAHYNLKPADTKWFRERGIHLTNVK